MKKLLTKVLLLALLSVSAVLEGAQHTYAQVSLHDSLRHMLTYFGENTKDDLFQKTIREAKQQYTNDTIDEALSRQLLIVDSVLVNAGQPEKPLVLPYASTLVRLFIDLPPVRLNPNYAASLNHLGLLYFAKGNYEKARSLYEQALVITKKASGEEHPSYASVLNNLANVHLYIGQYDKSFSLFQQALAIKKKTLGEQHPEYATILNRLAFLNFTTGHYDKAQSLYEQALAIRKKTSGEEHPDFPNSLNNFAFLYFITGQYDKVLPMYEEALALRKKRSGEEHPEIATILNRMALVYFEMGQYDKTLPLYEQALAIRKKISGEGHAEYATILNNLALLYSSMGQYDKALPAYQRALAIRKKALGEYHPLFANSLNNLAMLYAAMGQYQKALPLFQKSLQVRKKVLGEWHIDYATSLNNLAILYFEMKQYDKALPLYEQTLAITKKILGENNRDYAASLNHLANLYVGKGQYKNALPLFRQTLALRKQILGEDHPYYATTLSDLANLYACTGDFGNASALLAEASNSTLRHLNQTYAALSEQEKMKLLKIKAFQFDFLPSILSQRMVNQPSLARQVYANELTLKGMVLEDQQAVINGIRKSGDSTALKLYNQWRSNKRFLGKQLLLPIAGRPAYLDSLQEETNQIEQQLSRRTVNFRNLQRSHAITVKDIAMKLQKGQAAIEFISFKLYQKKWTDSTMFGALVLLPHDSTPHFISLFEERQLLRLLKSSAKQVNAVVGISKLYGGDSLYQLIWKPLEKYLTGVKTVYYAPAGLLHRIAFQALRADSSHLLIDKYQLNQVLSTRSVIMPLQTVSKPASAAIWGNIRYGLQTESSASRSAAGSEQGINGLGAAFNFYNWDSRNLRGKEWKSLPGTKQEMESITEQLLQAGAATAIDSGTIATEEAFKSLDGNSPHVLHIATHGFFLTMPTIRADNNFNTYSNLLTAQQNPMFRSGLILAGANHAWKGAEPIAGKEDGILTAYEIAQMDLSNTDLVVLSACETALGDLQGNEGAIGVQRAFKMAGVKQMIVSLWRVPDKETAELMTKFYQNWLTGQSTRQALRSAQLELKEKYPPYFWAAFVVVE